MKQLIFFCSLKLFYFANLKGIDLLIGGRGTMAKFFRDCWEDENLKTAPLYYKISIIPVKNSINIYFTVLIIPKFKLQYN